MIKKAKLSAVFLIAPLLFAGCSNNNNSSVVLSSESTDSDVIITSKISEQTIETTEQPHKKTDLTTQTIKEDYSEETTEAANDSEIISDSSVSLEVDFSAPLSDCVIANNNCEDYNIPKSAENLLLNYFTDFYSAESQLQSADLSEYFFTDSLEGYYSAEMQNTILKYMSKTRSMRNQDLSYHDYSIGLTYKNCEITSYGLEITLWENQAIKFNFLDNISYSSGIIYTIQLQEISGGYLIKGIFIDADVNYMFGKEFGYELDERLTTACEMSKSEISQKLSQLYDKYIAQAKSDCAEQKAELNEYNKNPSDFATALTADNAYDRESALEYAYNWVDKIDIVRSGDYIAFDDYGGNCQSYVSQCILAGGIPMDWNGDIDNQWKYFDFEIDSAQAMQGRAPSWSGTYKFHDYCEKNSGYGLVADTNANRYSGEAGDMAQYIVNGDEQHSVFIVDVVKDDKGNVIDYLINSNTTDRINYPLSAYGYTDFCIVRIIGWNN